MCVCVSAVCVLCVRVCVVRVRANALMCACVCVCVYVLCPFVSLPRALYLASSARGRSLSHICMYTMHTHYIHNTYIMHT